MLPTHLLSGAADTVVHLTDDRVLKVEGSGARTWLNSLLTADLRSPEPSKARYTLLLTPTARVVSDAWVAETRRDGAECLALVLPAARAAVVHATLERYLLNESVTMAFDDTVSVVTVVGPEARRVVEPTVSAATSYSCSRLGADGIDVWVLRDGAPATIDRMCPGASPPGTQLDEAGWAALCVARGIPRAGIDFDESVTPHEAGLDSRAITTGKGCYLGQEQVARLQRRRELSKRLSLVELDAGPPVFPGAAVRDLLGDEAGRLTSIGEDAARTLCLGYLRPNLALAGARVTAGERAGRVLRAVGGTEAQSPLSTATVP